MANKTLIHGLYGVIDTALIAPHETEAKALDLIRGGVRLLQLRAKDLGSGDFLSAARRLKRLASEYSVLFIINDRVDVALLSEADGVHLGQSDIPPSEARRLLGTKSIIGLSTHGMEEALRADSMDIDYISLGPIFPTSTKRDASPPIGTELLQRVKEKIKKPLVAIGGITEERLDRVLEAGADSVVMISDILLSKNVPEKVRRIVKKVERYFTDMKCCTRTYPG